MNKPAAVFIRAAISGYMGEPVTLYGLYAPDRDILMISRLTAFEPSRKNDSYTLITNKKGHAHDYFFSDQMIMNGVEAFYDRQNSKSRSPKVMLWDMFTEYLDSLHWDATTHWPLAFQPWRLQFAM